MKEKNFLFDEFQMRMTKPNFSEDAQSRSLYYDTLLYR
jgi:hypothetical protein